MCCLVPLCQQSGFGSHSRVGTKRSPVQQAEQSASVAENPRGALCWGAEILGMGIACSAGLKKGLYYLCTMCLSNSIEPFFSLSHDL